jgi:hypothetical protein
MYPHVSGRWQETSIWIDVVGGELSARTEAAVLNGANMALVETAAGWEAIQYVGAELVGPGQYRLDRLLRGQQGSEPAMAAGAPIGARVVFLTGAESRLDVAAWERGLELLWRAGAPSVVAGGLWTDTQTFNAVAREEWSPAHLKASWASDDLSMTWVRRARRDGDPWLAGEPPLSLPERYSVRISGGAAARTWEVDAPFAVYPEGERVADFASGGIAVIEVGQLGADGEAGALAALEVAIPAP